MRTGWNGKLTDWTDEVRQYTNNEVILLAQEAFAKVKARTPVKSGRLKAGWVMNQMLKEGILDIVISNDIEYVVFVEYGTDKVAGRFMVEQTINDLTSGV